MPAKPTLTAQRAAAGERYATAAAELQSALIELAAFEALIVQAKAGVPTDGKSDNMLTFAGGAPDALPDMRHREFLPNPPSNLKAAVAARVAELQPAPVEP